MVEKNSAWRAEPLTWGQGSRVFEVFLEPTCPFSAKAFGKLDETLQSAGVDNVTLKIWLHSQPWHLFSGVITRCALAASTLLARAKAPPGRCWRVSPLTVTSSNPPIIAAGRFSRCRPPTSLRASKNIPA